MRSFGFATWKAPAATKRTWSVLSGPYFVETVEPSTMGKRSRCTPSRETSGPCPPPDSRPATLSSSSMKMMPSCSARRIASFVTASMSMSLADSSSASASSASGTVSLRRLVRRFCGIMFCRLSTISSIPVPEKMSTKDLLASLVSISTMRSSSLPSRRRRRSCSRVEVSAGSAAAGAPAPGKGIAPDGVRPPTGGMSTSSKRSSACSRARGLARSRSSSRSIDTAVSARSRTIESTSRPT